ncbi:MAG TPA: hypothetical protein VIS76_11395, partial [Pseudomonadales bacterium]
SALKVPLTALFRSGGNWAVFKVSDGRAALQPIEVGHRTEAEVEILSGLSEADTVIQYPGNSLVEGSSVRQR